MVERVLLGLLLSRPMHGYELFQALQSTVGGVCPVNNVSQLYPFLRKMKDTGWLTETVAAQPGRPDRHVYSITDPGRHEFATWLQRPVDRRREVRDEFLAKLVMSSHTDLRHTLGLLDQQIEIYSAYKRELEARRAEAHAANELAGVLSLESGIRHSATDIEWATWCKAEINRRLSPEKDRS
jgi:DNA-binding PadR family transcriptional regulator